MKSISPFWTAKHNLDLWKEMDRFFDEVSPSLSSRKEFQEFIPASEIVENDSHFLLSIDLPGLKTEDIKIDVSENMLTVSGERKRQEYKAQSVEREYGYFKRSFMLPATINSEKIEAQYENGVLELYLPKSAKALSRKIEIKSEKGGFFDKLLGSKNVNVDDKKMEKKTDESLKNH